MKSSLALLFAFFMLVGCADQQPPVTDDAKPGDEENFNPITVEPTNEMRLKVREICSALEEKENVLDDYITHRVDFPVSYQESDCDGNMSTTKNVEVHVVASARNYKFATDTGTFGLPEVETLDSGIMKEICTAVNLPILSVPVQTANRTAIDFRIIRDVNICPNDSQHACILVKKGPLSIDGTKYRVSMISMVSFETVRGDRPGFYVYKNEKSFGSCGSKKYRTKIATFR